MHDAVAVQHGDPGADLTEQPQRRRRGDLASGQPVPQAAPVRPGQDGVRAAVGQLTDGVHPDQPLVLQPAQQPGLVEEAFPHP
ncbi:hypothetical protein LAH08_01863 [Micromonospora noduli]|uniref:Uncharacterized protein n=1 Tax=Micromonospora noduli TaxID=709876 RepID=A0A328N5W5_9ACTN|nr:hypothetical protein LAH08_01863 [Micromonospora noduli]